MNPTQNLRTILSGFRNDLARYPANLQSELDLIILALGAELDLIEGVAPADVAPADVAPADTTSQTGEL